jgi:hypothetical protein
MHRALAILKYVPAVLCGLLVVAWVVGIFAPFGGTICPLGKMGRIFYRGASSFGRLYSEFWINTQIDHSLPTVWLQVRSKSDLLRDRWMGHFQFGHRQLPDDEHVILAVIPIPVLLAVLIPFSIGCLTSFRFPLWSYFAWTAMVAVELAYYLRA